MKNATVEKAREEREMSEGRKTYTAFMLWARKHRRMTDSESLREWDEKYNGSRLRHSFGTTKELVEYALNEKYRKWLDNHCACRPNPEVPVSLRSIRSLGPGERGHIADATPEQRQYMLTRAMAQLRSATNVVKALKMPLRELLRMVKQAWVETEVAAVAAD